MPQNMTLEELGLLQLLEKVHGGTGTPIDRIARYGLAQGGLISEGDPPRLTDLGCARLDELRQARDSDSGEPGVFGQAEPDPTLA